MTSTIYELDRDFEALVSRIGGAVHPARMRTLRIGLHDRVPSNDSFDALTVAREYVSFLGLPVDEIGMFRQASRTQVEAACKSLAGFALETTSRQMPPETAERLATAWLAKLPQAAVFLINGPGALETPPTVDDARSLFHTDMEAGVLALSLTKVGMFWSAENS
ncbi:hypothetical protein [Polyangium aurulentum]|uniref:hypothetical protein n=1 Tax=Polyangium aurulentum TaxID=2567896 RepID=UPI0010ADC659|nr:hypothetical protein [Polyangium aurulentum]UQA57156.1 hypothetical protein E8A73_038590 [Polyangium aurulentum]